VGTLPTAFMKFASSSTLASLRPRLASADARFSSALRRALAMSFCVFSTALARCSSNFLCAKESRNISSQKDSTHLPSVILLVEPVALSKLKTVKLSRRNRLTRDAAVYRVLRAQDEHRPRTINKQLTKPVKLVFSFLVEISCMKKMSLFFNRHEARGKLNPLFSCNRTE